nr:MAG TPA: tail tape measure [Caudoviricetes sp.]
MGRGEDRMSREVDSRVVEMRFDNENFEKNTKKTISTIDRLMEKLQFKGAEKGFEKLDAAAKDVDFATMQTSLDRLESKFSSLNIVATTALVNITNKFVDAGEKLVKSLSIDQVASGWDKYTEKTSNVQTIMNATGKSIDQVNGYLNKLMWYSDETSYSFSEMTSALSQMTAAGGNIDKMIPMIMGIANATADAGKTGFAFQSTIRNLTQSYSAGHLQLQDWKSLNLMGTATKALKQELIDTAVELGVIKEGEVTIASFESSLQKKWANTEVMEKTFAKYASMMEAAYELTQKNPGMTSSEALEQLKGQYGELAERAALAAQQATSFAQAIDSTKDAASSKWMGVFETIFGNKEEATDTWTELANRLYDIFVPSIDGLNERLKDGLNSGWNKLLENELGDQADVYAYTMEQVALASGAITEKQISDAGSFGEAIKQGGISAELLKKGLGEAQSSAEKMLTLSDAELEKRGTNREEVEKNAQAFEELNKKVQNGTLDLEAYSKQIRELSGREHLMQSLWNLMDAATAIAKPIREAFQEIFPSKTGEEIKSFAQWLDSITKKLIISDDTAKKIKTTAEGVFSALRVGKDILEGIISGMVRVLNLTKPLADILLDAASAAGEFSSEITKGLHPLETIGTWVTDFVNAAAPVLYSFGSAADKIFTQFAEGAKDAFNEFDPEKLNQFILGGMGASMLVSIKGFLESIKSIGSSAKGIVGEIKESIESLGEAVDAWKSAKKADTLMTIAKAVALMAGSLAVLSMVKADRLGAAIGALTVTFGELLGVMAVMTQLTKNVRSLKLSVLAGGMVAVSAAVLVLSGALKVISTIDSDKLLGSVAALGGVMLELAAVAAVLSKDGGRFTKGTAGMMAFAVSIRILASSVKALSGLNSSALTRGLVGVGALCAGLVVAAKTMNGVKFGIGKGTGFVLMAASMEILQDAVAKFGEMDNEAVVRGLTSIGGALVIFVAAMNLLKGGIGSAISLTMMAAAVNLLVPAFQGLGNLSWEAIGKGLLTIVGAFVVLGGAAVILSPVTPVIVALSLSLSALALSLGALLALSSAANFVQNLASSLSLLNGLNFQVFLNGIKALAWTLVEFIAGVFQGLAEVASSLVTSIAKIIKAICDAIILAAPSIGQALYVLGTTVIDTVVSLTEYIWEKIEPALNDLWTKFTTWAGSHNPLDPKNWGGQDKGVSAQTFVLPFADILDELKNGDSMMAGIYQAFAGIGKNASEGMKEGQLDGKKEAADASEEVANAVIETSKTTFDSHSPSRVMAELGRYVTVGLAEGIADPSALAQAKANMLNVASSIRSVFTTFWGIHSPSDLAASDSENILEGALLGIGDKQKQEELRQASYSGALVMKDGFLQAIDETTLAIQKKMPELYNAFKLSTLHPGNLIYQNGLSTAMDEFSDAMDDAIVIPGKTGLKKAGSSRNATKSEIANAKQGNADAQKALNDPYGILGNWWQKAQDAVADAVTPTSSTKSKASKSGKSLADTLASAFSDKLKANKTEMSNATGEYALWEVTGGDTATVEELIAKKTESLTREIELQTKRVGIAKEQYDTLLAKVGANNSKTKDAYGTLLSEQKTLAELQRSKQDSILKVIQERYETDAKTAEDEYELWSALYEDSAEVTEKSNKKIDYINRKIKNQAEILLATEKDYIAIKNEFGEASQKTQAAYQQYLEAQTEQQKLVNELNQAQLDAYDSKVSYLEKQEKLVTNRQNMLAKLYGDGDLAGRADAYKAAVEQYGADSAQARKAATQGTMTAIIGVGTALDSMSYSLKKVTNKQLKYDEAVKKFGKNSETALDALADLQSEQYNFVGFAENLADAFELDDSGKRMMMQLGYSISKNWRPIQEGFNSVWAQVQKSAPEMAAKLSRAFGVATQDGVTEVITDLFGTITALVSGDWGGAVTGGITTVLDFMGSEFGQTMMNLGKTMLTFNKLAQGGGTLKVMGQVVKVTGVTENLGSILGNMSGLLGSATGGTGLLGEALGGLGSIGEMITGSGGLLGGLGELGGTLVSVLGSIGPEGWLIGAAIAGGGLLIANWDKVGDFFSGFFDWLGNAFSHLWDWISNGFKGLVDVGGNLISGLWQGITGAAGAVWNGICDFGSSIVNGFCDFFGIHSPSRVMAGIGEYLSLGLAQGITDETDSVVQGVQDVSDTALSTMMDLAQRVGDIVSDDFEYEPSIQPVVDMSDVQNGVDWLNDTLFQNGTVALNAERTAGLAANVVRKAELTKSQQEEDNKADQKANPNADIVSSVEALGEHIDSIARAVANMKVQMNGRKLVGEIINDVDEGLGKISGRRK